jgi:hypothetical protein
MADVIECFKPGFRVLDATGAVVSGAVLEFYDAGTSTPRTVYSDYALSVSLGTSVTCDSGGYPTSDGNAKVSVYTGTGRYKIIAKTSSGTTLWTIDQIPGALDTSSFLTSGDIVPSPQIENISTSQPLTVDHQGQYFNVNCSGGDVPITLDNAIDLGDGWFVTIRHDGSANQVSIVGTSSELFKIGSHAGVTAFSLTQRGQAVRITCDGAGFKVEESSSALFNTTGVILIADRLATPPGSPEAGARYIVTSSPTGDWSGYSQHDIAEADGQGGWFKITPPTDSGWLAYVQDEDETYQFIGSAWVQLLTRPADQSAMEAGTSLLKVVSPGVQHFHPSAAKFWAKVTVSGGTPTLQSSYNVSSITDLSTGILGVTIADDFSGVHWCCGVTTERESIGTSDQDTRYCNIRAGQQAAGTIHLDSFAGNFGSNTISLTDPAAWHVWGFGDQ